MSLGLLHFICGSTGAGKTTYAIGLSAKIGAARFSIDEWMSALFWMDSPQPLDPAWSIERVERCAGLIWRTAVEVAQRGMPCVLELGFTSKETRRKFAKLAHRSGLSVKLHFLDVAADERWRRVAARNRRPGAEGQLGFAVSREMFDFVETIWEPPTAEEMAVYDGILIRA
jgi:predicted kinase